jgi:uncharacterized protein YacL
MENFFYKTLAFSFMPMLLALHAVTQYNVFLYIYSALLIFTIIFFLIGIFTVLRNMDDVEMMKSAEVTMPKPWKVFVSTLYNFLALAYLLYIKAYAVASILVFLIIILMASMAMLWSIRKAVKQ